MPHHQTDPSGHGDSVSLIKPRWLPRIPRSERDQLFLTYLAMLALANTAFAFLSWRITYTQGIWFHTLGLCMNLGCFAWRWQGQPMEGPLKWTQWSLLLEAVALAWTSGGIFSPMLGWLAWASLPAVMDRSAHRGSLWIGGTALLILTLYVYAEWGGTVSLGVEPEQLMLWHLSVALIILLMQMSLLHCLHRFRMRRLERVHQHARLLHRMRDELIRAQKQKDVFVASVSHELRTPMNAILGLTDLIQHDKRLPEDIQSKIENIQKSSEHLLTIINDLLDYSQISAGALRVVSEPFDLHETLRTAYTILEPRALTKPLRYSIDIGPDVPHWILGDRHRLTQVLVNLLGNAIKFTGTGHVEMKCRFEEALDVPEHGNLHVEVNDTGIGISSENIHKLFEGFVQADSSIALRFGGNGLGLSITRNLIEAMGGSIGVESILGQGSRFFFTLPCQSIAPTHPVISSDNPIEAQGPIRILVVDDNPLNRQIASLQLRRQLIQAEIEQASGGRQALEMIRTGRFDVVLLDLLMPEMDGFETTQKVRNELPEPQCRTPIIALTANNDAHEHARCLSVGMNETMVKPFDRLLLCKKVLEHARRTV